MTSSSLSRTAAERSALAYQPDVHPAVRPLYDAVALLYGYEPKDTADAAKLLASLGGVGDGSTNAVAEIAELVKTIARHPVMDELPRSERMLLVQQADEYSDVVLQGEGEDTLNQMVHAIEGHQAPAAGLLSRAARALGGGR
ncbi:hypothetical protein [Streptomyces javensis]|uniref:Uncharacterized protein n=1 Tax=Streptomyces javensis TaxID=114698 RepID=A0ABS0R5Q8_9ACTN|nr:hypothetical protein [Streptomyces javensis]MBI0312726.1 hypothetical protein [Streptomyces javensis]